ncbi:MAG: PilZ domain-containing protein [Anaerolineae bacterium]|nr:PilZ domain-containing protein [Anaerolineae bacterium]
MAEKQKSESRHAKRFSIVSLDVFDKNSGKRIGTIVNLSQGGILVLSDDPIELRTTRQLHIPFKKESGETINFDVDARCVWCAKGISQTGYSIGFQFADNTGGQVETIAQMIQSFGQ